MNTILKKLIVTKETLKLLELQHSFYKAFLNTSVIFTNVQ
jgi:hypothetical protein